MLHLSIAGYVALDFLVVRRIGKDDVGAIIPHQSLVGCGLKAVTAKNQMTVKPPQIANCADRDRVRGTGNLIEWIAVVLPRNGLDP